MKSTTLALSLVALVGAFATLDMAGVDRTHLSAASAGYSVIESSSAAKADADEETAAADEEEEIEARLVNAFLVTERGNAANAPQVSKAPMLTPAVHRCVSTLDTPSSASSQYCFGAPAPVVYD